VLFHVDVESPEKEVEHRFVAVGLLEGYVSMQTIDISIIWTYLLRPPIYITAERLNLKQESAICRKTGTDARKFRQRLSPEEQSSVGQCR
jgi:hypothetical protein